MPRSRLFLKIFGWFWISLAAMVTTQVLMLLFFDSEVISTKWYPAAAGQVLRPYGAEAVRRYLAEGRPGLKAYWQSLKPDAPGRVYLFDPAGTELLGQPVSSRVRRMAGEMKDPGRAELRLAVRSGLIGMAVPGDDGRLFAMVIEMERRPTILPSFGPGALGAALLALSVLAAICFLVAKRLAFPVMRVSQAAERLAAGDLSARALDEGLAGRRDEFADLARNFDHMAARIETLVRVQERLLWDISHELRSPLTRLSLALGIARRKAGADAKPALDRIERETEQLNHLIQQLLTIARIKGGAGPAMNETVELAAVLDEIAADADFEARGQERIVRLVSDCGCLTIGSRDLLKSAFENVVRNAIRFTAVNTEVLITLRQEEDAAVIAVRDHGPGVPDSAVEHLFDTFYRVPEQSSGGGAGLGLAITQQAVAAHRGWVKARNAQGGGLLVEIGLPISPASR